MGQHFSLGLVCNHLLIKLLSVMLKLFRRKQPASTPHNSQSDRLVLCMRLGAYRDCRNMHCDIAATAAVVLDAGQSGGNDVKPEQIAQQVQQAGNATEGK